MIKIGQRKFLAFLIAIVLYTGVVIIAMIKGHEIGDMSSFVFQLASSYAILCGLFYGSNVLSNINGKGGETK